MRRKTVRWLCCIGTVPKNNSDNQQSLRRKSPRRFPAGGLLYHCLYRMAPFLAQQTGNVTGKPQRRLAGSAVASTVPFSALRLPLRNSRFGVVVRQKVFPSRPRPTVWHGGRTGQGCSPACANSIRNCPSIKITVRGSSFKSHYLMDQSRFLDMRTRVASSAGSQQSLFAKRTASPGSICRCQGTDPDARSRDLTQRIRAGPARHEAGFWQGGHATPSFVLLAGKGVVLWSQSGAARFT